MARGAEEQNDGNVFFIFFVNLTFFWGPSQGFLRQVVEVRVAAVHGLLDEALVDSPLDLEVSVESPGWPPGVRNEPIGDLVLDTPPDDLDGVPSRDEVGEVPPRPAVHSTLVREEALMHEEAGLDLSRRTGKGGRVGESAF